MTALLVLKPGLTDTVSRVIARMLGVMCIPLPSCSPQALSFSHGLRLLVISYRRRHWLRAAVVVRHAVFPYR